MSPLSPIKPAEEAPAAPPRALRLPLDPLLTLAVVGLGICSIVTLSAATRNLVTGNPHYYVDRQAIYLAIGFVLMLGLSRLDYARLRRYKNVIYGALVFSILAVLGLGHSAKGAVARDQLPAVLLPGLRGRQDPADRGALGVHRRPLAAAARARHDRARADRRARARRCS